MQITIKVSDERTAVLEALAAQDGLTVAEFVSRLVEEMLTREDDAAFSKIADYVMQKNAELYRRLSRSDISQPQ